MDFKTIRFEHSPDKIKVYEAFNVVKKFIIKNERIVKGGMALDCAFRLRGHQLYSDDDIPDYDMISPIHHIDAYNLANELINLGFEDVQVINAIHITTMKIRVLGEWVADIAYYPQNIYDSLVTLNYENMLILHPYYTMMDQGSALSRPFDEPPREVIFSRWKKDNDRMKMIYDIYPFETPLVESISHKYKYPKKGTPGVLLGYPALYAHINGKCKNIKIPERIPFMLIEDANGTEYNPMLDAPPIVATEEYMYMVSKHIQYVVNEIDGVKVASLPLLVWFFLHRWLFYKDAWGYQGVIDTFDFVNKNPNYNLDIIYGSESKSPSYLFQIDKFTSEKKELPSNAYPKQGEKISQQLYKWKPDTSHWFHINGLIRN